MDLLGTLVGGFAEREEGQAMGGKTTPKKADDEDREAREFLVGALQAPSAGSGGRDIEPGKRSYYGTCESHGRVPVLSPAQTGVTPTCPECGEPMRVTRD